MNSDTTVWQQLRVQMCASTAVVLIMLAVPLDCKAQEGFLRFHGHVVNATCAIGQVPTVSTPEQTRRLPVTPGVAVSVNMANNACAGAALPFSSQFQPLAGSRDQGRHTAVTGAGGVLTITYQ